METLHIILIAVAVILAGAFVIVSKGQKGLLSLSFKSLASFAFTALGLSVCFIKGLNIIGMLFVLGLIASCFGDVILGLPDMPEMEKKATPLTLIGGLCFSIAHCFYMAGMILLFGFKWWVILIAVGLGLVFYLGNKFIGKLNYGPLEKGMPVYATFVSLVVAQSIMGFVSGANLVGTILLLVGFFLFWLSDIVLMNIYFGQKPEKKVFLYYFNLSFYYLAQILVATSLIFLL